MIYLKRLLLIISISLGLSGNAIAQEEVTDPATVTSTTESQNYGRRIIINKVTDNWEVTARVGTQAYLGEYVLDYFNFGDWWTFPAVDITIQKWATHCIGISFGVTNSRYKGLRYAYGDEKAQFIKPDDPLYTSRNMDFYVSTGSFGNVYASGILNLCHSIGGYKKGRIYNLVISLGGGIMFPTSSVNYRDICASFNAGLHNQFRLTDHITFDLSIRGTLHDDMFNGISYYTSTDKNNLSVDATIGLTAGVSYRFNLTKSKSRNAKGKPVNEEGWTEVNSVVKYTDAYREASEKATSSANALSAANDKIEVLENTVVKKDKEIQELNSTGRADETHLPFKILVNFKIDRWEISNREKINILFASETIKSLPDKKFMISGFADKQTAKPAHNQMLSENRATAVFDCLVNEFGVNPDQLVKSAHGGVDYMYFNDAQCSRSAIITVYTPEQ